MDDQNRRLAELLRIKWVDVPDTKCEKCGDILSCNNNYATDPRLVLREMMKRPDYEKFLVWWWDFDLPVEVKEEEDTFFIKEILGFYILDTTGLLRNKVIEYLEENQ